MCHEKAMIHFVQALNLTENRAMVSLYIMNNIAAFGSPDWLDEQIIDKESRAFFNRGINWIYDPSREESVKVKDLEIILPEIRPALPYDFPEEEMSDNFKKYWLDVGLKSEPDNMALRHAYIHFLKPRWGGSYEEMYEFINSDYCKVLDKKQKA